MLMLTSKVRLTSWNLRPNPGSAGLFLLHPPRYMGHRLLPFAKPPAPTGQSHLMPQPNEPENYTAGPIMNSTKYQLLACAFLPSTVHASVRIWRFISSPA